MLHAYSGVARAGGGSGGGGPHRVLGVTILGWHHLMMPIEQKNKTICFISLEKFSTQERT